MLYFAHTSTVAKNPKLSYYAKILSRTQTVKTTQIPSMAVSAHNGKYLLLYNPNWTRRATYTEFVATLAHEAMHIELRHIPRSMRRYAVLPQDLHREAHSIMNIALDATLNQLIAVAFPHMRTGASGYWVFPEPLGLPVGLAMEDTFEIMWMRHRELMARVQEILNEDPGPKGEDGDEDGGEGQSAGGKSPGGEEDDEGTEQDEKSGGGGSFEAQAQAIAQGIRNLDHQWAAQVDEDGTPTGEASSKMNMLPGEMEAAAQMLEEEGNKIMKGALRDVQKSRGTLPAGLRAKLDALLEESRVSWTTYLKNLVAAKMLSTRRRTNNRPHKKRFTMFKLNEETGLIERLVQPVPQFPGIRRNKSYVVMFAIDTSGSMSNTEVIEGLSEMQGLLKSHPDAHLIVVQCDTQISSVDVVGPDIDVKEYVETIGRTSCGGTTFDDPFILAKYLRKEGPRPDYLPDEENTLRKLSKYDGVDIIIYHTDGYAPAPAEEVRPSFPTIWLCSSSGSTSALSFGHVIQR